MASKNFLVNLDQIDFDNPIAEVDEIRDFNPQRHEMEQLSAIVYENLEDHTCVGYLDVTDHEFWVRGHMPGFPIMPGVIMLESVAQMCSYFVHKNRILGDAMLGFGGVEQVRFRRTVSPGSRLILIGKLIRVRPNRMVTCEFQGIVDGKLVLDGSLKGIPLPVEQLKNSANGMVTDVTSSPTSDFASN